MQSSFFSNCSSNGQQFFGGSQIQYNSYSGHTLGRFVPSNSIGITSSIGGRNLSTRLPSGGFVWGIH